MTMDMEIYWLNGEQKVFYKKLTPGERYEQRTTVGHRWRAVVAGEENALEFEMPKGDATWRLQPKAAPKSPGGVAHQFGWHAP